MEKPLAKRTLDRATAAMRRDAIACLPEIVKLMRTLAHNSSQISVPELADVIQKDAVILAKVIGAANTFGYNPGAVPVTTVNQAIHVIGYERIRSLAMSLMLVEQSNRGRSADEQREVAALALTSGCIAQSAAGSRAFINPEEAFVCASLRNFGRLVMVSCMIEEYREAQQLAATRPSDDAFRQIFGLTPLELGHTLLQTTDLPEELLASLQTLPPAALAALDRSPSAQMLALTDFAAQLAEIALAPNLTAAAFASRSRTLAERYNHLLPALAEETLPLIESASEQLQHFVHTLRIKSLPAQSLTRLKQRAACVDPAGSLAPAAKSSAVSSSPTERAPAGLTLTTPADAPPVEVTAALPAELAGTTATPAGPFSWSGELERISGLANTGSVSRDALFTAAVDAVRRGLETRECLLFSGAPGAREFQLSHGAGICYSALAGSAAVRQDERTVFGVCLTRGENVLIHHSADSKLAPYLPGWLPSRAVLGSFVLLPIVSGHHTRGLILAGWNTPRQIVIAPEHVRIIRTMLATICQRREPVAA